MLENNEILSLVKSGKRESDKILLAVLIVIEERFKSLEKGQEDSKIEFERGQEDIIKEVNKIYDMIKGNGKIGLEERISNLEKEEENRKNNEEKKENNDDKKYVSYKTLFVAGGGMATMSGFLTFLATKLFK